MRLLLLILCIVQFSYALKCFAPAVTTLATTVNSTTTTKDTDPSATEEPTTISTKAPTPASTASVNPLASNGVTAHAETATEGKKAEPAVRRRPRQAVELVECNDSCYISATGEQACSACQGAQCPGCNDQGCWCNEDSCNTDYNTLKNTFTTPTAGTTTEDYDGEENSAEGHLIVLLAALSVANWI